MLQSDSPAFNRAPGTHPALLASRKQRHRWWSTTLCSSHRSGKYCCYKVEISSHAGRSRRILVLASCAPTALLQSPPSLQRGSETDSMAGASIGFGVNSNPSTTSEIERSESGVLEVSKLGECKENDTRRCA
jgi:hypothetical protein